MIIIKFIFFFAISFILINHFFHLFSYFVLVDFFSLLFSRFNFLVKPFIIRGPYDQTVVEGSSVTFQCRVGGEPVPDILWRRTAAAGNMPLGKIYFKTFRHFN